MLSGADRLCQRLGVSQLAVDRAAQDTCRGTTRGTDSTNQADLGGHGRTPSSGNLSSGGHLRIRRDTRGHTTNTIRDRETPGSNPGPRPFLELEINIATAATGMATMSPVVVA